MTSPLNRPQDPQLTLLKVLRQEQQRGYNNRSVVGGLDRLLERHQSALASSVLGWTPPTPSHEGPQRSSAMITYAAMSAAQREQWVQATIGVLEKAQDTVPPRRLQEPKAGGRPRKTTPPAPRPSIILDGPLSQLRAAGRGVAQKLERLGLQTVRDLLHHFPRRYNEIRQVKDLRPLEEEQAAVVTLWEAAAPRQGAWARKATEAVVGDETGNVRVVWFNQPYLARSLRPNARLLLSGRVGVHRGQPTFESPDYEPVTGEDASYGRPRRSSAMITYMPGHLLPIYPSTEGLSQRALRRAVREALTEALSHVQETLPSELRERQRLLGLHEALSQAHFPDSSEHLEEARRRLALEELLLLQLWALGHRREWRVPGSGIPLPAQPKVLEAFLSFLPFHLTAGQQRAMEEVLKDMEQPVPMNRLLHGEVGSGKTVVALAALLTAATNGYQGALMAPTEILAEQHFLTVSNLLAGAARPRQEKHRIAFSLDPHPQPLSIGLLVGSMTARQKEEAYKQLADGTLDMVIGTHAIIQEGVTMPKLALAVVDEQHRFGVAQRTALRQRSSGRRPHLLVMSATPIPRTLTLTLYGDLDISAIGEMPPGRQPVRTRWAREHQRQASYDFLRRQVEQGRQAFVICPLIEESEALQVRAATEEHQRLSQEVYPDLRLGLLHGRQPAREKSRVVEAFRQGELDVLVSTPVVEVGVDVPNATVMLVEGADRFGLAQLHQLRGRVGRGQYAGYCLLLSEDPSPEAQERMALVERLQDGFALAEEDLRLRGPGEYAGVRQSGMPDLHMARLSDRELLLLARQAAAAILEKDPQLERPEHRPLKEALERQRRGTPGEMS
ncbi:MAG: ATP-dependent DNA helicase RecG [Dehalococcoidia bacterium]|nr:ATP-dependent DNA helicase RecG [Dehalococcoidia bacterium]